MPELRRRRVSRHRREGAFRHVLRSLIASRPNHLCRSRIGGLERWWVIIVTRSQNAEMDPYARKGTGKAWKGLVPAERARKGPPSAVARAVPFVPACTSNIAQDGGVVGDSTRPVGVVGEGLSSLRPRART